MSIIKRFFNLEIPLFWEKPEPKPKRTFHPPNYPLANIYNPSQKYKDWTGF